jgi:membrane-bound lytic murein transglycosylase B
MTALRILLLLLAVAFTGAGSGVHAAEPGHYAQRQDVRQFIADMVDRHGFVERELRRLFGRARYQPAIVQAMTPPPEAPVKSWQGYRAMFVSRDRIDAGARFRSRHAATLARAAQEYGVPEEIIVAILGVETVYGRNMGSYRIIDALATLAFDFPRRSEFFRSELESFLLYARESGIDVLTAQGSYAGAFGIPQFMPGTYRRYAVDYDGDGQRDLNASPADAIGSVANFLKAHGWEPGQPVAARAQVSGDAYRKLVDAGIKPVYSVADLAAYGVAAAEPLPADAGCALVELETPGQAVEYWVGLQNFYALTRYNRSSFYAIAVLELAREIARASP